MSTPSDSEVADAHAVLARASRSQQVMGPQSIVAPHTQNLTKIIVPKLVEGKFHFWKCRMMDILLEYGLHKFVESNDEPPTDSEDYKSWHTGNQSTRIILRKGLSDEQLIPVIDLQSAYEVWRKLTERHLQNSHTVKTTLMKQLLNFRMKSNSTMTDNLNRLSEIRIQLKAVGYNPDEDLVKSVITTSLPSAYDSFKVSLDAQSSTYGPALTVEELIKKLLERETSFEAEDLHREGDSAHFAGRKPYRKPGNRFTSPSFPSADQGRGRFPCLYCKELGHWKSDCPHLKKKGSANLAINEEDPDFAFCAYDSEHSSTTWYIDTGATMHMTYMSDALEDFHPIPPIPITLGNNETVFATGEGSYSFHFLPTCGIPPYKAPKVWFVPAMKRNLFSTPSLPPGTKVEFLDDACTIHNSTGDLILCGKRQGKLFHLSLKPPCASANLAPAGSLWHRCFGHLSPKILRKMQLDKVVTGMEDASISNPGDPCATCELGKQTRVSYPPTDQPIKTSAPLELVYSDLCGPLTVPSLKGRRYILTFLDDFSRFTWIYFLTRKGDVFDNFIQFKLMVEKQHGYPLKKLKSDNGTEYINKDLKDYCSANGIIHLQSAPYIKEQLGTAERLNSTMVEKTRCMIFEAHSPGKLWAEAFHTAIYLKNRSSTRAPPKLSCKGDSK